MKLTLLDTQTGETVDLDSPYDASWWAHGNGMCDCNRADYVQTAEEELETAQRQSHPELQEWQSLCYGCERILIIAAESDEYTLHEFNQDYPQTLKAQWLKETAWPNSMSLTQRRWRGL